MARLTGIGARRHFVTGIICSFVGFILLGGRLGKQAAPEPKAFGYPIAFNVLPQIDVFQEGGYTKEEYKMVHETTKIMGDPTIKVTATCDRVPVFNGHSESVNIETESKLTAAEARRLLARAAGVVIFDDPGKKHYPLPAMTAGKDEVYVGRIREDNTIANGLNLWTVADNVRKGATLNAVQIAETMLRMGLLKQALDLKQAFSNEFLP